MANNFETLLARIDALLREKERVLLAIDGSCGAGKTTLAEKLREHYGCSVFHMDEFFLRSEQRTAERFAEVGGNIDYERFAAELLAPLKAGETFSYRPFDCSTFALKDAVRVTPTRLAIIEGSYSQHPYFGAPYDLTVFLSISPALQRERILARPAFLHERFFSEWIPMEERYFEAFSLAEKADLTLRAEDLAEE